MSGRSDRQVSQLESLDSEPSAELGKSLLEIEAVKAENKRL